MDEKYKIKSTRVKDARRSAVVEVGTSEVSEVVPSVTGRMNGRTPEVCNISGRCENSRFERTEENETDKKSKERRYKSRQHKGRRSNGKSGWRTLGSGPVK